LGWSEIQGSVVREGGKWRRRKKVEGLRGGGVEDHSKNGGVRMQLSIIVCGGVGLNRDGVGNKRCKAV